jgi:hypothetical protein
LVFQERDGKKTAMAFGFPRQPIGVQASEVGDSHFFADVTNLKLQAEDFGGISGCPCFFVREGKPLRLVGFATDYSEMTKRLQFTYARYIRPDGVVDYMQ